MIKLPQPKPPRISEPPPDDRPWPDIEPDEAEQEPEETYEIPLDPE